MAVTFVAAGTVDGGDSGANINPTVPAGIQDGDYLLLAIEGSGEIDDAADGQGDFGGELLGTIATGTSGPIDVQETRLTLYGRFTDGTESAWTMDDPGDHGLAGVTAWRGVHPDDPFDGIVAKSAQVVGTTAGSAIGIVTSHDQSMVVTTHAIGDDSSTYSNAANSDLTGFAESMNGQTNWGTDGELLQHYGKMATAGTVGNTTFTLSAAEKMAHITIAFRQAPKHVYFDPDADGNNDGTSWEDAYTSASSGISSAGGDQGAEDVVLNFRGTFVETARINMATFSNYAGMFVNFAADPDRFTVIESSVNNTHCIRFADLPDALVQGPMILRVTADTDGTNRDIMYAQRCDDTKFRRLMIDAADYNNRRGFQIQSSSGVKVCASIIVNTTNTAAFRDDSDDGIVTYIRCTAMYNTRGFYSSSTTDMTAIGCLAMENSTSDYQATWDSASSHCVSSAAVGSIANSLANRDLTADRDPGTGDWVVMTGPHDGTGNRISLPSYFVPRNVDENDAVGIGYSYTPGDEDYYDFWGRPPNASGDAGALNADVSEGVAPVRRLVRTGRNF